MDRAIWRPARSEDRPDRLDRAHSNLRDAQLRAAGAGKYASLSGACGKQPKAFDRSRSPPRRLSNRRQRQRADFRYRSARRYGGRGKKKQETDITREKSIGPNSPGCLNEPNFLKFPL